MDRPLYQLADEYLAIAKSLGDQDLPDEAVADTLEGASGDLETKAWHIAALILQFEGDAEAIKAAEDRMAARRKALERRIEWLREYLLVQLLRVGISQLDSPEFTIRVRDNPPKVVLDDEAAIPKGYKRIETVVSIRKDEIRQALLAGKKIAGAHLVRDKRLAIK